MSASVAMPLPAASGPRATLAWLGGLLAPRRALIGGVLLLSIGGVALGLAQPWLSKLLIDDGLLARDYRLIAAMAALMVAAALLGTLVEAGNRVCYLRLSASVLFTLREAVYRHLQGLSPSYYARTRAGELLARLDGDVAEVQRFAIDGPLALVNGVVALLLSVAVMLQLSPELSLLAATVIPLEVWFLRRLRPRLEARTRALRDRGAAVTAFLVETLQAMKFIQSSGAEAREHARLRALNADYLAALQEQQLLGLAAAGVPRLLAAFATAAVFAWGGYRVVDGSLSVGTLLAFSAYLLRATGPAQTLLGLYLGLQRARVSLERVGELLQQAPAVTPPAHPVPLPADARGALDIDGVDFAYAAHGPLLLRGARLHVAPGTKVALTGASGVGKSTLIDLLLRHFDPRAGHIRLDGVDLRELDPAELRRRVVVVSQEVTLFAGSLGDNLAYLRPQASLDELHAALAAARLDGLALDTPVGSGGGGLSGGQRQRLALARALLLDPLLLILDEASSALDAATAREVAAAVDARFADRTRLVIAHRLDTVGAVDAVVELRDGRLVAG